MKSIKIFAAALAATALMASCAKDGGQSNQEGEPTYAGITISFKSNGPATRAPQEGTTQENALSKVTVFVIDDNTGRLDSRTFVDGDFDVADVNGYRKATKAVPTTVGDKTVYVVANATSTLEGQLGSVSAIKADVLAGAETNYYTTSSGSAWNGEPGTLKDVVMTGQATKANLPKWTEADAILAANVVQVGLTRNVAKVAVQYPAAGTITKTTGGDAVSVTGFALAAKAQSSYLMPQTNTALYADPTAAAAASYWTNNFSARDGLGYIGINPNAVDPKAARACFALEHTPEKFYEGNTTQIVVAVVYTPKTVVTGYTANTTTPASPTLTTGTITTGTSFWVHKATRVAFAKAAYDAAILDSNNTTYGDDDFFTAEYEEGESYYQIPIKEGNGGAMGVKRNHYYMLTIDNITGFGNTQEEGDTDQTPLIEESNIAATIKVLDWTYIPWNQTIQ